jgi:hypothetical protein
MMQRHEIEALADAARIRQQQIWKLDDEKYELLGGESALSYAEGVEDAVRYILGAAGPTLLLEALIGASSNESLDRLLGKETT